MENNDIEFKRNLIIKGNIVCDTGLHIGESNDSLEIGGVDNMVMRDKKSNLPYIPGSSLKGKLRSLLELYDSKSTQNIIKKSSNGEGDPCNCGDCVPCQIFGFTNINQETLFKGPTRIIVRDSFPGPKTIDFWDNSQDVVRGSELKVENTIDRMKATAKNPRPTERVPKGSIFLFEIVFSIYNEKDIENFKNIFTAMRLLEDNYLGGSGTRGYGKIHFILGNIIKRDKEYYAKNKEESIIEIPKSLKKLNENEINLG